jgi:hypothetical protein
VTVRQYFGHCARYPHVAKAARRLKAETRSLLGEVGSASFDVGAGREINLMFEEAIYASVLIMDTERQRVSGIE